MPEPVLKCEKLPDKFYQWLPLRTGTKQAKVQERDYIFTVTSFVELFNFVLKSKYIYIQKIA